jgi:hypothetical protein
VTQSGGNASWVCGICSETHSLPVLFCLMPLENWSQLEGLVRTQCYRRPEQRAMLPDKTCVCVYLVSHKEQAAFPSPGLTSPSFGL